ncbi:MAG TPA: ATP-binding protein [Methylomirabilota bacterium]|jgi:C4-dicarboxylate-specific signal transduction histidine kinase
MGLRLTLIALGVLWHLAAGSPAVLADERPPAPGETPATVLGPVRNVLLIHVVPRSTPALLAVEQTFTSTLRSITPERLAFHSEYVDLAMFEKKEAFETELVAYLAAKYAHTKLDLVGITGSDALRFTMRHRAQLFAGVPVVFIAVMRRVAADIALDADVSGVWLSTDWKGTLAAARRLQPDVERAVVVSGASPVDRIWAADARAQLARLDNPISITYLEEMSIEGVVERVAALPPRTVVLLGAFLTDATGRRFSGPETSALLSSASPVPVYVLSETQLGYGAVGGRLTSFELQGRRGAEIAAMMLRGERPPPIEPDTLAYRFDARQLRRFGLDARRLPPGSAIEFERPSLWRAYRGYLVAAAALLALQAWTIIVLLANRAQRRRVQQTLAAELRFETLISDLLASHLTLPAAVLDSHVERALALIGAHLDVDRVVLVERDADRRRIEITHAWTRDATSALPRSIESRAFPWISERLAAGHTVVVSPLRPLPAVAETDRRAMLRYGTRSMLAVPLVVEEAVVGVLSCATMRSEREWPEALINRLRLVAKVFASALARREAEAAARESEARFQQQREDLARALRINTLGELGTSLAHEINQPLSAILLNARTLLTLLQRGAAADTTATEALADIAADARRAGDIIARLRALSRKEHAPERGVDLNAVVDEVTGLMHQDFVRRGIVVHRFSTPALPTVSGDRIQLQQIFLNLLVNASEALEGTERGYRDITIATGRPAAGLVEVAVRDSGAGAKHVDIERMFERFVTTKPDGLGMGLAISRSIAAAHGGRIYAKANADRGLTVYVELPAEA